MLVRRGKEKGGFWNPIASLPGMTRRGKWWEGIRGFLTFSWKSEHGPLTKIYFIVTYSLPMLSMLSLYMLVAFPFWGLLCLKGRLGLLGGLK